MWNRKSTDHEDRETLDQVSQAGCRMSFLRGFQDPTEHSADFTVDCAVSSCSPQIISQGPSLPWNSEERQRRLLIMRCKPRELRVITPSCSP